MGKLSKCDYYRWVFNGNAEVKGSFKSEEKEDLSRVGEECENIDLVTAIGFTMAAHLSIL